MKTQKIALAIEFILLFFGVPTFLLIYGKIVHPSRLVLPVITLIFIYLYRSPNFRFKELINFKINKKELKKHLIIILVSAAFMFLTVYLFDRKNLFNLPKGNTKIWLLFCVFYPVFSAFGQEIIYRLFLFKRYKPLFNNNLKLILASAITFSYVHIVYFSYISIILTFLFGLYVSKTYLETKSLPFVALLHGIFGNLVFTLGLGGYFWLDMHKWLQ